MFPLYTKHDCNSFIKEFSARVKLVPNHRSQFELSFMLGSKLTTTIQEKRPENPCKQMDCDVSLCTAVVTSTKTMFENGFFKMPRGYEDWILNCSPKHTSLCESMRFKLHHFAEDSTLGLGRRSQVLISIHYSFYLGEVTLFPG